MAGRIFTSELSAGGDFSGRRSYNGETLYGTGDILIRGRHINIFRDYLSPGKFFVGRHFNVTSTVTASRDPLLLLCEAVAFIVASTTSTRRTSHRPCRVLIPGNPITRAGRATDND